MKAQITLLDSVQTCEECGMKIKRGKTAINVLGGQVYFCGSDCLIKKSEETD